MAKKSKAEKTEWDDLPEGYQEKVMAMTTEGLKAEMAQVTVLRMSVETFLKEDMAVAQAKAALDDLTADPKADIKAAKLAQRYLKVVLNDRGQFC
jgi:hypothetical protein